jgi:uncharacterized protein (DUF58 family)
VTRRFGRRRRSAEHAPAPAPRELLRQVRHMELRTRRLVNSYFSGEYLSVFKGPGIEFAEVREYLPGDDVRTIDWNVTARLGVPYVKKFVEERELTVLLAVDVSGSQRFGTARRFKSELVAEVALTLAMSAVRNNDRVGLLAFSDRVEAFVPPRKGRRQALRLLRDLLTLEPAGRGTDLAGAIAYASRMLPARSVLFVFSDFELRGTDAAAASRAFESALRGASLVHDVVAITVTDPREEALPDVGVLAVRDPESGRTAVLDTAQRAVREAYDAGRADGLARVRRTLTRLGIDEIELHTDRPYAASLLAFFRRRERRRG